jgi:hypothetical protein
VLDGLDQVCQNVRFHHLASLFDEQDSRFNALGQGIVNHGNVVTIVITFNKDANLAAPSMARYDLHIPANNGTLPVVVQPMILTSRNRFLRS